ncbi:MAG: hypothetical protein ACWGQW_02825 [bacterium]
MKRLLNFLKRTYNRVVGWFRKRWEEASVEATIDEINDVLREMGADFKVEAERSEADTSKSGSVATDEEEVPPVGTVVNGKGPMKLNLGAFLDTPEQLFDQGPAT